MAGVTPRIASHRVALHADGQLLRVDDKVRHRDFRLAGSEFAGLLDMLRDVTAKMGAASRSSIGSRFDGGRR